MSTRRIVSAALALLLAVSFATPSGARALSADEFEYTVTDGVATVTGCTGTCPTTLIIPSTLGGFAVTSIGAYAFVNNLLTTLTLSDLVTSIGDAAFAYNAITAVTIPNSVTTIGTSAFEVNRLTTVTIGNSVTTISSYAFYGNLLTTLTLPNSVTTIGAYAFANNLLTTLTLSDSVTSIDGYAFESNLLTTLTIPNSVMSIGDFAFDANLLTSVTFLGNTPTAGNNVFVNNSGLTSVTRPYTATGWGATWSGVPVVVVDVPTLTVRYNLFVTTPRFGTITSDDGFACAPTDVSCARVAREGRTVTFSSSVLPGHTFVRWNGCTSGSAGTCSVTLNSETTISASYGSRWLARFVGTSTTLRASSAATVSAAATDLSSLGTGDTITITGYAKTAGAKALERAKVLRRALRAAGVTAPITITTAASSATPAKRAKAAITVVWGVTP
jgi:hypothetical protein